ncbi:MAG TPA: acyl-CoA dehydrogenase [Devosia sp.]|nr:acyl-CoA dehydrogenase [Devosia sp.]
MVLALIALGLVAFGFLAMRRAPLWQWAMAAAVVGVLGRILALGGFAGGLFGWLLALVPAIILGLFAIPLLRRLALTGPAYGMVKSILPRVSRTEQDALDAGTVGWDAELFSGKPDYARLFEIPAPHLTAEEQAFIDGPVEGLCAMLDDWDIRHNRADLSPETWQFLKDNRFFGMLISKEHGGLGFSAQAQSQVVSKIASRSVSAGITVMVPNSLGPGELLEKYGTPEQKEKYLQRLATGIDIPCFALTGPHAGSDAAGMRDVGVVCYEMFNGKKTLGVKLSWDKRYITLAPVATLVGLAFNLHDPDHLLGDVDELGITLALVPADFKGVEIGRRHYPSRSAFMNGPTRGRGVFVPMDFLIGGVERAGQGWRMLMECLATGRAISLPAIGSTSIKHALRVTSAYARVRRQFGIPVGVMEGVADPLSRMVRNAYVYEAARGLTAAMVDEGQKPSVLSAVLKYRTTEAMRDSVNDAMDIHGGRAVQDGPSNYLFGGYATTPVAITVEGANILTRTLITFAQGALRAHPYLYSEIEAAQDSDRKRGIVAFDAAFSGHISFMLRNIVGSFLHAVSFGRFAAAPEMGDMTHWYRQLSRYSQSFALVGDWTVAFLGGDLKRKQRLSGRMADILSELYLLSATLRRYEDDGRPAEDRPVVDAAARDCVARLEQNFATVFANFPNFWLRNAMRVLVFPLGRHAKPASDRETYALTRAVLRPGALRDRLTRGVYVSMDPKDVTGVLEDALIKVTKAEDVEAKFIKAIKKQKLDRRLDRDAITDAVDGGILTEAEAAMLRLADQATDRAIRVDDFDPDELASRQLPRAPAGRAAE